MALLSNLNVRLGKNSYKIRIENNFPFKLSKLFAGIKKYSKIIHY